MGKRKHNMKFAKEQLKLYAITDRSWLAGKTLMEQVEHALKGGATMIQLREKHLDEAAFLQEAEAMLELCHRYHVPLIINDRVELAKKVGADGVHVGQSDMQLARAREILGEDAIIGVTAKTVAQAKAAEAGGATYLGSGAVFGTSTKTDAKAMTLDLFQEICESVSIPVVAIGGIHEHNIEELAGRKMTGFAIISGIFASDDIEAQTKLLLQKANQLVTDHNPCNE